MPAQATPITPAILTYLKEQFPPALIDGMVKDGEYVIVDEQNQGGQDNGSNNKKQ